MKSLLSVRSMGRSDLESLIGTASEIRDVLDGGGEVEPTLQGICMANMFFEPSTRTRLSFDLAAQRLGARVITFDPETSSSSKGESLRDTVLTVAAIADGILVVRHGEIGVPAAVAEWTGLPVINAGDGTGEHPTQALIDAVTMQRHFGRIAGLRVGIVGDVSHSRVAGSLIHALPTLGAELTLVAPPVWLPKDTSLASTSALDDLISDLDVVYLLRVQTERGGVIDDEYVSGFQLHQQRLSRLNENAVIMHPGPMNRGVEIGQEVADSPRSLVIEQVRNGVPTRMAVLAAVDGRVK